MKSEILKKWYEIQLRRRDKKIAELEKENKLLLRTALKQKGSLDNNHKS